MGDQPTCELNTCNMCEAKMKKKKGKVSFGGCIPRKCKKVKDLDICKIMVGCEIKGGKCATPAAPTKAPKTKAPKKVKCKKLKSQDDCKAPTCKWAVDRKGKAKCGDA